MNNPNISRLVLLKTSLENDYKNTIWFGEPDGDNTKTNQTNYFLSKKFGGFDFTNLTYIRKDHSVKIPAHYDSVVGANYVMYQNNPNYNANNLNQDKWYYAFVVDIKYISEGVTELVLETDVIQTWYFAYKVQPSFVEREHVSDDTIGANTYPEVVELGEYVCNKHELDSNLNDVNADLCYVVGSTSTPESGEAKDTPSGSDIYNGIYSGVKYYRYDKESPIDILLEIFAKSGKTDAITGIFMAPKVLAPLKEGATFREVATSYSPVTYHTLIDRPNKIDNYAPRNNKLLTYPYSYLLVSNNNGNASIYKYERFSGEKCRFSISCCLTPGCSVRLTPSSYNGISQNDEEGLNLGKYPICNYTSDMYTNWLTQNSVNIANDIGMAGAQIVGGIGMIATGGGAIMGAAGVASGIGQIGSVLGQIHQQSHVPPQARGNINCGDVITSMSRNTFHYYDMSIKSEYAKIIDNYFDMFGYKVCRLKEPNKNHRARYWYTKTIDCNVDGGVPQKDLQKIKDAYNNGITFWRFEGDIGIYKDTSGYNRISNIYG